MTPNINISSKTLFFPFIQPAIMLSPFISVICFLFPSRAKEAKKRKSGCKANGKVTFRKFQPKIEEYVLRQSQPVNRPLVSVPDSGYTNSPFFRIETVTDVAFLRYTGKSLTIMLSAPQPDFSVKCKHPRLPFSG